MKESQTLSGLQRPFGQAAWVRVKDIERYPSRFSNEIHSIWDKFSDQVHLLYPYNLVLKAIIDKVLPVMDKNNESDCYTVCMLLRHLENGYISEEQQKEIDNVRDKGDLFQGLRKLALVTLLQRDDIKGTVLEQYLSFPLTLPAVYGKRTNLFSIA